MPTTNRSDILNANKIEFNFSNSTNSIIKRNSFSRITLEELQRNANFCYYLALLAKQHSLFMHQITR